MAGIGRRIGSVLSQFKQSDQGCVCQISAITASSSIPAQAEMTFDVEFCAQHHGRTGRKRRRPRTKREAKKSRGPYTYHICIKRREFAEKASAEGAINAGTTDGFYHFSVQYLYLEKLIHVRVRMGGGLDPKKEEFRSKHVPVSKSVIYVSPP